MPGSEEATSRRVSSLLTFGANSGLSERLIDVVDELVELLDLAFFSSPELPSRLLLTTPAEWKVFLVDWESSYDLDNPMNWGITKKWVNIGIISVITFLTYVPGTMT